MKKSHNEMYFTAQPTSEHHYNEWTFELLGHSFTFLTDSGVFSKKTVDYGSRLLIETFNDDELPEGKILDIGAGYGPIGLSLAKQTHRFVEMIDRNERAIELTQKNAEKNQLSENIHAYPSNLFDSVTTTDFAAIVSNPPVRAGKRVVHEILEKSKSYLKIGGTLTIVLQKKQGAPSAQKKMADVFGNVEIVARDKGYYLLKSYKRA